MYDRARDAYSNQDDSPTHEPCSDERGTQAGECLSKNRLSEEQVSECAVAFIGGIVWMPKHQLPIQREIFSGQGLKGGFTEFWRDLKIFIIKVVRIKSWSHIILLVECTIYLVGFHVRILLVIRLPQVVDVLGLFFVEERLHVFVIRVLRKRSCEILCDPALELSGTFLLLTMFQVGKREE